MSGNIISALSLTPPATAEERKNKMKKIICLILVLITAFSTVAEISVLQARSPTLMITVKRKQTDPDIPDYGRGGSTMESKIVYLDIEGTENSRSTNRISTSAIIYTKVTEEDGNSYIIYHLLNNFDSSIILKGYDKYYYQKKLVYYNTDSDIPTFSKVITYSLRVYDCSWEIVEDNDGISKWTIKVNQKSENNIDDYIYGEDDSYSNISEFFWKGIVGLSEESPISLYEGSTYIQTAIYGPINPYDIDVEIYYDDMHNYNEFAISMIKER